MDTGKLNFSRLKNPDIGFRVQLARLSLSFGGFRWLLVYMTFREMTFRVYMQALYDRLYIDLAKACLQSHECASLEAVKTETVCLLENQWSVLDCLGQRGIVMFHKANCRVSLRWKFGKFVLDFGPQQQPGVQQLPLNSEHVLFVPELHDVAIMSSADCRLILTIARMKPEVHKAIREMCQIMVLSPRMAVRFSRKSMGASFLEHFHELSHIAEFYKRNLETPSEDRLNPPGWLNEGPRVLVSSFRQRLFILAANRIQQAFRAHLHMRCQASVVIQRNWRQVIGCPQRRVCRSRLLREFSAMSTCGEA